MSLTINIFFWYIIMVLMNGPKSVRNQASVINRVNCGGVKKAGLSPSIGNFISSNPNLIRAHNTQWVGGKPPVCQPWTFSMHPTQKYGYKATLGMM
jgi:hypothetical protein